MAEGNDICGTLHVGHMMPVAPALPDCNDSCSCGGGVGKQHADEDGISWHTLPCVLA